MSTQMARMGPSVRNLLIHYAIDPSLITSTGPRRMLLKGDVLFYIQANGLNPRGLDDKERLSNSHQTFQSSISNPCRSWTDIPLDMKGLRTITSNAREIPSKAERKYVDIELTNMRRTVAKRLLQSKQNIPHAYTSIDCNISALKSLRNDLNKTSGMKASLNDFIIKIAALALRQTKEVNSRWNDQTGQIEILQTVDISLAVATPNGLITPIIKNANHLSVVDISKTVKELAERARAGKLQPHEFQGGTFSISNLGMFGIDKFSAVINSPQAAILAIGSSRRTMMTPRRPLNLTGCEDLVETVDLTGAMQQADAMSVTLSYDSRVCQQTDAARYMEAFCAFVENPDVVRI